jgi:hypothetical protein
LDSAGKFAVDKAMSCAELHSQQCESAESQYVFSQCNRSRKIWVYNREIHFKERRKKVQCGFRGNLNDSCSSAKCNLVRNIHANLPDTLVALTCASKYFQMLPATPGACAKCSQSLEEHLHVLRKTPGAIHVHSGWFKIWLLRESNVGTAEASAQVGGRL